jgi:hypothetical protein
VFWTCHCWLKEDCGNGWESSLSSTGRPSLLPVYSAHKSSSSPKLELERLKLRDSSTHEEASSRLSSQMSIEKKVAYADVVIDNSSSIQDLER